jgi:hypothetical protein
MLDELSSQNTVLGNALKDSFIERIKQRRTNNSNMFFFLEKSEKQITNKFNQHQSKTEITKPITNLIQMPADIDVDVNDTTIVPAELEKPDQSCQHNKTKNGLF